LYSSNTVGHAHRCEPDRCAAPRNKSALGLLMLASGNAKVTYETFKIIPYRNDP